MADTTNSSWLMVAVDVNGTANVTTVYVNVTPTATSSSSSASLPLVTFVIIGFQIIFACLILSTNALTIFVFLKESHLLRANGKYLLALSVVDFSTGLTIVFQLCFFIYPELSRNKWACMLRFQLVVLMTLLSLMAILAISFERFLALYWPNLYIRYTKRKVWLAILSGLWLYVLCIFMYPLLGFNKWDGATRCKFPLVMRGEQMLWMAITNWIVALLFVAIYILLWHRVKAKLIQVAVQGSESQFNPGSETTFVNTGVSLTFQHTLHSLKVAFVMTLFFTICWIPYSFVQFLHFLYPWDPTKTFVGDILVFIGISNSFMNPFIYGWLKKDFRKAFLKIFCCCKQH